MNKKPASEVRIGDIIYFAERWRKVVSIDHRPNSVIYLGCQVDGATQDKLKVAFVCVSDQLVRVNSD